MTEPLILATLLASYSLSETMSLGVEKLIIKDEQLPKSWHNLKVIFVSDIHHGRYSSVKRLRKLVAKINQAEPDLILYGGDNLQTGSYLKLPRERLWREQEQLMKILSTVKKPPFGSFAVLGNHDYGLSIDDNRQLLSSAKIRLLVNEGVNLDNGHDLIRLDGVDDMWDGKPDFKAAHGDTPATRFTMLLTHQPNFIDELTAQDGVNFVFSGHTHGSQVRLLYYQPFMPRRIARWEYTVGLVETPQTRMLVSPGIGNSLPYFRLFSPPKIHLVTFKSAPHAKALPRRRRR